jgi:hypothetical protein
VKKKKKKKKKKRRRVCSSSGLFFLFFSPLGVDLVFFPLFCVRAAAGRDTETERGEFRWSICLFLWGKRKSRELSFGS